MTGGAGAQDVGKIARALLRLQFERSFDWNSATGFENGLRRRDFAGISNLSARGIIALEATWAYRRTHLTRGRSNL